jgi:hypothetical protein
MEENVRLAKHDLLFGVRRSIRYHARRRMFFDNLYKWSQVLTLISGSATVVIVMSQYGDSRLTVWFAAAVAVFSALNLVFRFAESARLHSDLTQKFSELEKRIILNTNPSLDSINALTVERLDIEAIEPPILRTLDMLCHNELCRALGYGNEAMVKINYFQRICAPFFDLMDQNIQAPKSC